MLELLIMLISVIGPANEGRDFIVDSKGHKIQLRTRALPPRWQECHLCHPAKQKQFIHKKKTTLVEHKDVKVHHGRFEIMCQHCHDVNFYNYPRSGLKGPMSFENTSGVCQDCHADRYRDWREGIHGKRVGSWSGEMIQYHCIDCHPAHDVVFKPMNASPPPEVPKYRIPSHHDFTKPLEN